MTSPQVVLWYIGTYGLKVQGVRFYQKGVLGPIWSLQKETRFWLVDLTAWGALRERGVKTHQFSSLVERIETWGGPLKCLKASDMFKRMEKLDPSEIDYFKKALRKEFVHLASEKSPKVNIPVGELFEGKCPVVEEWSSHDAGKFYSALQYLEGCLIIEEIVRTCLGKEKIEIIFVLPNDELKYYRDETDAFQRDVSFLLEHRFGSRLKDVKVTFYSFTYGEEISHRPYNAPGKVFKKNELSCDDILKIKQGESA
jgi:hypothetical protein